MTISNPSLLAKDWSALLLTFNLARQYVRLGFNKFSPFSIQSKVIIADVGVI